MKAVRMGQTVNDGKGRILSFCSRYIDLKSVAHAWTDGLMVLMYHSVDVPPLWHRFRGLYVAPRLLERQLRELQSHSDIQLSDLETWHRDHPAGRQVVLTFDDAYQNLFVNGLPVLRERGVRAITYVVASLIGKSNEWDAGKGVRWEKLMDRVELQEWIEAGNDIGAHSMTHRNLARISPEEARREIFDSKKLLEDMFGRPVRHFCYPYGGWNRMIRDFVHEAGYETATTTDADFNDAGRDSLGLLRVTAQHRSPWLAALTER